MKVTRLGYDPDLSRKFFEEKRGGITVLRQSKTDEPQNDLDSLHMHQSAQETHDQMNSDVHPIQDKPETEQDGINAEALRHARVRKLTK